MTQGKNYQIIKLVASGGTAVLYKALQTSLDRVVAVKKLHQHLTEDENFTRRFVLEAKAAASLDHDNIVKIIDFGSEENSYYMVMEFIEGESLREVLNRWKHVPVDVALTIVYNVCEGLEHAHMKGIVHRDVKPGNIMLTRGGKIKVTDFGLAKLTQATTEHTAANSILGTPLYMSPEQAFGESVDHRSDLFSLGTVLYELITGAQPFRDENYMGVIQNIIKRNAPHPSRFDIDLPPSVQSIMSKAMNKSRDARYQSAGDFKKAIEKHLGLAQLKNASQTLRQLLNTEGDTVMLPRTIQNEVRKSRLRRGFVVALTAATLFGAAGFGYSLAPETINGKLHSLVAWANKHQTQRSTTQVSDSGGHAPLFGGLPDSLLAPWPGPDSGQSREGNAASGLTSSRPNTDTSRAFKPPKLAPQLGTTTPKPVKTTPVVTKPKPKPAPARRGWISVKTEPWSEVYIDGKYRGDSPPASKIALTRGTHTLECRNPKFKTYRETLRITAGEMSVRNIVLQKTMGRIALTVTPGAEVYVDGVLIGNAPLNSPIEVEAGKHQLTIKKPGFNVWNNSVEVGPDASLPLTITLSPMY